jgi:hypothetical protein
VTVGKFWRLNQTRAPAAAPMTTRRAASISQRVRVTPFLR